MAPRDIKIHIFPWLLDKALGFKKKKKNMFENLKRKETT
jgi:hypothetical protein